MYAKTTLTVALALLASTAFAAGENKMGEQTALPSFTTLDADQNGAVTQEEAQSTTALVAQWKELDADQNGTLSSAEYANAAGTSVPDEEPSD